MLLAWLTGGGVEMRPRWINPVRASARAQEMLDIHDRVCCEEGTAKGGANLCTRALESLSKA